MHLAQGVALGVEDVLLQADEPRRRKQQVQVLEGLRKHEAVCRGHSVDVHDGREACLGPAVGHDCTEDLLAPLAVSATACQLEDVVERLRRLRPQQRVPAWAGDLRPLVGRLGADVCVLRRQTRSRGRPHLDTGCCESLRHGLPLPLVRSHVLARQGELGDHAGNEAAQVLHLEDQ
eukprot:CAMPEP_0175398948 /NCGR_PEP_ID=MMETSP0095-20121207/35747_1 /TAXON_ID=311494 /ORGANISM="Alexandrium monilatum, Strain CCMP3105" /LENGTH=175 /DNA_ID=CAMNT_0016697665 /DNA_START=41 /DNA_END=565 /DNA_ORIENTATION=+